MSKETDFRSENSLLSRDAILKHIEAGNIVIEPFDSENLITASYDVSLGENYYREQDLGPLKTIYSPYSENDVKRVWGEPQKAELASKVFNEEGVDVPGGIFPDDLVILLSPGETILGHTQEFIGGQNTVTTMMKARSSAGRNFLTICKCAGWGDVGYINRWTLEITNNSQRYVFPLVVGRRYAQVAFFQVDPIQGKDYSQSGKYQIGGNLEELKAKWNPEAMIPKMWKDREITKRK